MFKNRLQKIIAEEVRAHVKKKLVKESQLVKLMSEQGARSGVKRKKIARKIVRKKSKKNGNTD